jgi:hypothetical protein
MRTAAGALLAFLALGVLGPAGARAGCLYPHGTAPGRGVAHLDALALAGALSVPIEDAIPAAPVSPCAGLRCSGEPAPSAPSAPVVPPRSQDWGCLAGALSDPDPSSSPLPVGGPAVRPRHGGPSLFHPPR